MGTSLGVFDLNLLLCVQETIIGRFYSFPLKATRVLPYHTPV